jgi:hypothetical protein
MDGRPGMASTTPTKQVLFMCTCSHFLLGNGNTTWTSQVPKDIHWPINMPHCTKHDKSGSTCSTVAKFTPRQPGFTSRRVHFGFVMDEVVLAPDLFFNVREMSITMTPLRHIHSFVIRRTVKWLAQHMPQLRTMSHFTLRTAGVAQSV